jgi:molybdopterin converting factor small subunit
MVHVTSVFMSIARQRAQTAGEEFESKEERLRQVLEEIVGRFRIADIVYDDRREVRPWTRVLVNGRSHEFLGGLDIDLHDGDRIAIVYPYADNF